MMLNQPPIWLGTRALRGLMVLLAASYGIPWNPSQCAEAFTFKQRILPRHKPSFKRGMSGAQHCNRLYMGRDDVSSSSSGWKNLGTINNLQRRLRVLTRGGAGLLGGDGKEDSALLLRVNFSAVEVENLRAWIRRCSFSYLPVDFCEAAATRRVFICIRTG